MIASVCSERSLMATLLAGAVFASASVASAHAPPAPVAGVHEIADQLANEGIGRPTAVHPPAKLTG